MGGLVHCENSVQGSGSAYRGRTFTAALAIIVVDSVWATNAVLLHTFAEVFEKDSAFKAHFADAAHKTDFSKAEHIVGFFDFVHAPFELDAFSLVRNFDGWREGGRDGVGGGFASARAIVSHCHLDPLLGEVVVDRRI